MNPKMRQKFSSTLTRTRFFFPSSGRNVCSLIFDALLKFNDMENYATRQIELRYKTLLNTSNFFFGLSRKNEHAQYRHTKKYHAKQCIESRDSVVPKIMQNGRSWQ